MAKELLRSSNYWTLNKTLVKKLGIETAFFLTNLIEAEHLMKKSDGWFFQTIEKLEEVSTLSRRKQDGAIKELEQLNLIEVKVKGMPAKRYFRINESELINLIFEKKIQFVRNEQTSLYETNKQVCAKRTTSKESTYKENKYKSSSSVYDFYQQNFGMITPFIAESIGTWINDLNEELVIESMKLALKAGKRFNYAEGVLKSWYKNNVRTVKDVEAMKNSKKPKNKFIKEVNF